MSDFTGREIPISKTARMDEVGTVSERQLEAVNRFTRRSLGEDEVFVFPLTLCDNEVDRDLERFPVQSLERLSELFVGKTGVFDHTPKAENQAARIFETEVVREDRFNSLGEPYCRLKAWAYMVRCEKNRDLILEIDAGIKKEVSVGCSVARAECSICGENRGSADCPHQKGKSYNGKVCHCLLVQPTDAYEWSFVAVPAQTSAGVTKSMAASRREPDCLPSQPDCLEKLFDAKKEIVLTAGRLKALEREFRELDRLAQEGREYLGSLRSEVVRMALLAQPELESELVGRMVEGLESAELQTLLKSFGRAAGKAYPLRPQLSRAEPAGETGPDNRFRVGYGR